MAPNPASKFRPDAPLAHCSLSADVLAGLSILILIAVVSAVAAAAVVIS